MKPVCVKLLFAGTIFTSAFLLFLVQPLIAKQILPWFGGSAAVWSICMVFFQVVLLAGYAYSDWITRHLRVRTQALLHGALLATSVLLFRLSVRIAPFGGWVAAIGRASLVIMYLHVAVIHYLSPYLGKPWLLMQALLLPLAAYYLIRTAPALRRIFL